MNAKELDEYEDHLVERMVEFGVDHHAAAVSAYVMEGTPFGGFLTALFENNLMRAMSEADDTNKPLMGAWCKFIYNACPSGTWGSPKAVRQWRDQGGLKGSIALQVSEAMKGAG